MATVSPDEYTPTKDGAEATQRTKRACRGDGERAELRQVSLHWPETNEFGGRGSQFGPGTVQAEGVVVR